MPQELETIISVTVTLLLIVLIFVGSHYATKFIGSKYQSNTLSGKSKIKIIERATITREQSLLIVKVDGKVLLLGCGNNGVNKIEELNADNFSDEVFEIKEKKSFVDVLKDNMTKRNKED